MMLKKCSIAICIVCAWLGSGHAQNNFKNDIVDVSRHMALQERYSVTLHYAMYVGNNLAKPFETRLVTINQEGNNYNMLQGRDFELIENKREQLNVDHKHKIMYYLPGEATDEEATTSDEAAINNTYKQFAENFDSLNQFIQKVNLLSQKGSLKEYEIIYKQGEHTRMIITMDINTGLYKSLNVYYREKRVIEQTGVATPQQICMKVNYENYNTAPVFNKRVFDVTRYIIKKEEGSVQLQPGFKSYQLTIL